MLLLQLAARYGHAEAIRVLVEEGGANVQARNDNNGWVALHEAASGGHVDCVKVYKVDIVPSGTGCIQGTYTSILDFICC